MKTKSSYRKTKHWVESLDYVDWIGTLQATSHGLRQALNELP